MSHRKFTRLAAAVAVASFATACGGSGGSGADKPEAGSGTGTISIWASQGQPTEAAAIQSAVDGFNSSQAAGRRPCGSSPKPTTPRPSPPRRSENCPTCSWSTGPPPRASSTTASSPPSTPPCPRHQGQRDRCHEGAGHHRRQALLLGQFDAGLGVWGDKKLLKEAGVKYPTGLSDAGPPRNSPTPWSSWPPRTPTARSWTSRRTTPSSTVSGDLRILADPLFRRLRPHQGRQDHRRA